MNALADFYRSSIGKKIVVAVTGFFLILYVVGHLLGNLQIFLGPDAINEYAQKLRDFGPLLWLIRFILLGIFVVHIIATISLAIENRRARGATYAVSKPKASTAASRSMVISGLLILAFVIYHLLHFTFQTTHPEYRELHDEEGLHDVYSMMILGFQDPWISGFYILSMFLLAMHLSHGFGSIFQTVGARNARMAAGLERTGVIFAWLVFAGYSIIPIAVLAGWVTLPPWFSPQMP